MYGYNTPQGVYTAVSEQDIPSEYPRVELKAEPSAPEVGYHWEIDWTNAVIVSVKDTPVVTLSEVYQENKLLKAQIQAMDGQYQFLEDCIAEMAAEVYR